MMRIEYQSGADYASGFEKVYSQVSGELTEENVIFVGDECSKYERLSVFGNSNDEADTYTGNYSSTYLMFNHEFYKPMSYLVLYSSRNSQIVETAKENIEIYKDHGNVYEQRNNEKIIEIYNGRSLNSFYDYRNGILTFFETLFSSVIIVMLNTLAIPMVFINEKSSEMNYLLATSKNGRQKTVFAKISTVLIWNFFINLLFGLSDFLSYVGLYNQNGTSALEAFNQPIYAIEKMQHTPLNITIGEFFLMSKGLLLLSTSVICMIMLAFSMRFKRILSSFVANVSIVILLEALYQSKNYFFIDKLNTFNPFNLIYPLDIFRHYNTVNFLGFPILESTVIICLTVLILIFLIVFISGRRGKSNV